MNRRKFLGIASTSVIAKTAGRIGGGSAQATPSESDQSASDTPSSSGDEKSGVPVIEDVALVTEWRDFGDIDENRISAAAVDAEIEIAYRVEATTHDNVSHTMTQVRIFNSERKRVAQESEDDKQLVGTSGSQLWEHALRFDTEGWEKGEYKAEILVRDEITGQTSEAKSGVFELSEPLHNSEIGFVSVDAPSKLKAGKQYQFSFEIRNTSGRDGTFRSPISVKMVGYDWEGFDEYLDLTIAAGSVGKWTSGKASPPVGEYVFRLDAIDETWNLTVEEN